MPVTDRRWQQAGGMRQAPSDNQTSAHSCRPVHTAAISKWLVCVTRQGSLLEQFYRLMLGKRGGKSFFMTSSVCLEWDALVWLSPQHAHSSFTAQLSLQCVHNLMRRRHLVNACHLPPTSVCITGIRLFTAWAQSTWGTWSACTRLDAVPSLRRQSAAGRASNQDKGRGCCLFSCCSRSVEWSAYHHQGNPQRGQF